MEAGRKARAMIDSARGVCSYGRTTNKSEWLNDEVKPIGERKETVCKDVLGRRMRL